MRRLTTLTKLYRNYLFASQEAQDRQYARDISLRLQLISDARQQMLEALIGEDADASPDSGAGQIIKECKDEISYQLDMLEDFVEDFTSYCRKNGLEIETKEASYGLDIRLGRESELYIICREWETIGKYANEFFISQLGAAWPDGDMQTFYSMREKMVSCFMETYRMIDMER